MNIIPILVFALVVIILIGAIIDNVYLYRQLRKTRVERDKWRDECYEHANTIQRWARRGRG